MNVELHIEELILHGFDPKDRYRIARTVEIELGRIFAERGVPSSLARDGTIPGLDAGAFEVECGSTTEAIGVQLARALYGGLIR